MPKSLDLAFSDPAKAPYLSVVSPSTHDMSTLRVWWTEDPGLTGRFAWQQLGEPYPPDELTPVFAEKILRQHLESPAMWVVVPLQDWLAIDESLRHSDPHAERINVPAIMPYYWRYRMHLPLEQLISAEPFNRRLAGLLADGQRVIAGEA
jgi:4-alpha-glucanotransferase